MRGAGLGKKAERLGELRQRLVCRMGKTLVKLVIGLGARPGSLKPQPLGRRLELPPEEGSPYSPEFSSGWEPPATDPHGRACEDPVDRQLQHERRRQQVRLKLRGEPHTPPGDTVGRGPRSLALPELLLSSPQQSAPQVAVNG